MRLLRIFQKRRLAPSKNHMPGFDASFYLDWYPDVRGFSGTPLEHYLRYGWKEGRDPSAGFSGDKYLENNPDVKAGNVNPLIHFLEYGITEGRRGWNKDPSLPAPRPLYNYENVGGPQSDIIKNLNIFMYWTNKDLDLPPAYSAWKSIYPNFKVFSDEDVLPLLPPSFVKTFSLIRLPSAKSDIARFFLLREHGGVYVDAHVGPTSPSHLIETLGRLADYNVILFARRWLMVKETDFDLMNGVLAARPGAPELDVVICNLINVVIRQKELEDATSDYVAYDLVGLTGSNILVLSYFYQTLNRPQLQVKFQDKIFIHLTEQEIDPGFELYAYYNYRKKDDHWSERQKHERFFLSSVR